MADIIVTSDSGIKALVTPGQSLQAAVIQATSNAFTVSGALKGEKGDPGVSGAVATDPFILTNATSGLTASIHTDNLSVNRSLQLPDEDSTLATIDWVAANFGHFLGSVGDDPTPTLGGDLNTNGHSIEFISGDTGHSSVLSTSGLTADRTLAIPDKSGTLATLADVTGGTDATTTAKGIVQLAGDLGGTAAAPTVPGLAGKFDKTGGTISGNTTVTGHFSATSIGVNSALTSDALDVVGNFQLLDADTATKVMRWRTNGANVDVETGGKDAFYSVWSNADYTGTQHNYFRLEAGAQLAHAIGQWIFSDGPFGGANATIDGITGNITGNHYGSGANLTSMTKAQVGLANVDNTSDINKPVSTAQKVALNQAPFAASGRIIYDKSYWSDLSDFTVTGTTPTLVNGAITVNPGTPGSFDSQALELNGPVTADDQVDFEVTFKVTTVPATVGGIGLGRQNVHSGGSGLSGQFDCIAPKQAGLAFWQQASGTPGSPFTTKAVTPPGVAVGDIIRLTYSQRINTVTLTVNNITQHKLDSFTITNNMGPTKDFAIPAVSKFRILIFSGAYTIESVRLISRQPTNPTLAIVGDSKTFGYASVSADLRYASLIKKLGPVSVFGGDADRTVEAIQGVSYITALKPQYVIMCIGRNDLNSGVATATWQANYSSMVASFKAAGATVIHLMPIPETTQADQSALTSYINTTFPSDGKIDPSVGWSNASFLSADNIHPNTDGHRYIANKILSSGLIPVTSSAVSTDVAPYMFQSAAAPAVQNVIATWQTPTLATGWTVFDTGGAGKYGGPQYLKDSLGFVHLRGLATNSSGAAKSPSTGALILTLPAGFRPYQHTRCVVSASPDGFYEVDVNEDGTISLAGVVATIAASGWINLNNISFLAEN